MRVQVCSDLHLERHPHSLENAGADLLVLSGDITAAKFLATRDRYTQTDSLRFNAFRQFFDEVSERFAKVIYVSGNHEFYGFRWRETHLVYQEFFKDYPNIHYLEQDYLDIGDVRVLGGTLWTDMNGRDPATIREAEHVMNDYKHIVDDIRGFTKLRATTTAIHHSQTLNKFSELAHNHSKVIVCSHHAPSPRSIDPQYAHETHINGAYMSELESFILARPQIKLWTHGHMHSPSDYHIGECNVVANPRGYVGYEARALRWTGQECVVEV